MNFLCFSVFLVVFFKKFGNRFGDAHEKKVETLIAMCGQVGYEAMIVHAFMLHGHHGVLEVLTSYVV